MKNVTCVHVNRFRMSNFENIYCQIRIFIYKYKRDGTPCTSYVTQIGILYDNVNAHFAQKTRELVSARFGPGLQFSDPGF